MKRHEGHLRARWAKLTFLVISPASGPSAAASGRSSGSSYLINHLKHPLSAGDSRLGGVKNASCFIQRPDKLAGVSRKLAISPTVTVPRRAKIPPTATAVKPTFEVTFMGGIKNPDPSLPSLPVFGDGLI